MFCKLYFSLPCCLITRNNSEREPFRVRSAHEKFCVWARPQDSTCVDKNSVCLKFRALSIQTKLSKIWKRWQMVQKFPRNVSRNFESCWISEMQTIQPKILEIPGAKLNAERKLLGNILENLGIPSWSCPLFRKFWKCCSFRYWKLSKIQTRRFDWMESALHLQQGKYIHSNKSHNGSY